MNDVESMYLVQLIAFVAYVVCAYLFTGYVLGYDLYEVRTDGKYTCGIKPISILIWTGLFGLFYLLYKGWWKSALVGLILYLFTLGIFGCILPIIAIPFVESMENLGEKKT
jgi:hydrogenase/urease accessory protein HupE